MAMHCSEAMERSSCDNRDDGRPLAHAPATRLDIVVGDTRFSEERTLLIQGSDYFQALCRSGMKECQGEEIHLGCVSARGFQIALAAMRGERPMLDADQIVEAIECAAFLQAASLTKHLVDLIDSDNCLLMCHTAATFGLTDLYRAAAFFIRNVYRDLGSEVKRNLPTEVITYIESLTPSVFVAVGAHATCGVADTVHTASRVQAAGRTVCYLDESENLWKVLTDLPPEASTSMAGVTVLDNKLYVVGGIHRVHRQGVEVLDSAFCYSVEDDRWSAIAGLRQLRYNCTLVGRDGRLYAIGGEYERTVMSSVEIYDVESGGWTVAAHLPRPAAGAACAKAMSRIFVCLWKPMETSEIYEYHSGRDEWSLVTTLIRHQSYGHYMVGHGDNLYVMRNGPSDDFLRCMMDCYNLTTGQWTALPGHFANSKGALFTAVVRGDSALTLNRSMTQEYAIEGKTWKPRNQMKGFPRSGSVWTFLLRLSEVKKGPHQTALPAM